MRQIADADNYQVVLCRDFLHSWGKPGWVGVLKRWKGGSWEKVTTDSHPKKRALLKKLRKEMERDSLERQAGRDETREVIDGQALYRGPFS